MKRVYLLIAVSFFVNGSTSGAEKNPVLEVVRSDLVLGVTTFKILNEQGDAVLELARSPESKKTNKLTLKEIQHLKTLIQKNKICESRSIRERTIEGYIEMRVNFKNLTCVLSLPTPFWRKRKNLSRVNQYELELEEKVCEKKCTRSLDY